MHVYFEYDARQKMSVDHSKAYSSQLATFQTFSNAVDLLEAGGDANQTPFDDHMLCGREQGELKQMALVLFSRGSFL